MSDSVKGKLPIPVRRRDLVSVADGYVRIEVLSPTRPASEYGDRSHPQSEALLEFETKHLDRVETALAEARRMIEEASC